MAGYALFLFLVVPCVDLQSMIVAFPGHLLELRLFSVTNISGFGQDHFISIFLPKRRGFQPRFGKELKVMTIATKQFCLFVCFDSVRPS